MQQAWGFALDWYHGRASLDWQPTSEEELQAIFERNGLMGDFWRLG